jgi:pimeloyl-ACP methyl ester carboxylesterase
VIVGSATVPGVHVADHEIEVPLDWAAARAGEPTPTITVFARELVAPDRRGEDLPALLYLQGGPGGKSPRVIDDGGWIGHALRTHRVVLLDQRGTGRSTPVTARTMARFGDDHRAAGRHLALFRADSIVQDAEALRQHLEGGRRWSTLGQSYGGFLTLTYLSLAPEGLSACYVTGGLASLDPDADEVYRRTYPRTAAKNAGFHARYPGDAAILARLADRIDAGDVTLPDGDVLTVERLQTIGIDLGMGPGRERIHALLDEALDDRGEPTDVLLAEVQRLTSYAGNPLFAAMQESIYASGTRPATAWAAERQRAAHPAFAPGARPLLLTGEMMYPWMFDQIRLLRPFRGAVEELARRDDWPELYDTARLAANEVPLAAAIYHDDMYVDAGLQQDTVARVGNARAWITNEHEHDGLGAPGVLGRLMDTIARDGGGLPR